MHRDDPVPNQERRPFTNQLGTYISFPLVKSIMNHSPQFFNKVTVEKIVQESMTNAY